MTIPIFAAASASGLGYFTVSEARMLAPLNDATKFPAAVIDKMRITVEQSIEDACQVAFVPRETTEIVSGDGRAKIMLQWPKVTAVNAISIDQYALSSASGIVGLPTGVIHRYGGWPAGFANISVRYIHGYPKPPLRVKRAAMLLTKYWLVNGPVDERAMSMSSEDGTFALATPGMRGSEFGLPEVDRTVQLYSYRTGVM